MHSAEQRETTNRTEVRKIGTQPFVMLDAFNLGLAKGTGIATYARNLSFNLRDLGYEVGVLYGEPFSAGAPPLLREVLFYDSQAAPPKGLRQYIRRAKSLLRMPWNRGFEVPVSGAVVADSFAARLPHFDSLWNARDLYVKSIAQFDTFGITNTVRMPRRPALFHWTYPLPLRVPNVPNIYTVHDLIPLRLPHTTLDRKHRYFDLLKWIGRTAAHIVTISENSKRDIVELLGIDPDRVTNTYQAVGIPPEHAQKPEELVRLELDRIMGLPYKEYLLFFGAIEPKKNLGRLIEAYLTSDVRTPLVIVGSLPREPRTFNLFPVDNALEELRATVLNGVQRADGRIVRMEYVPFASLVNLIRGAKAVLFPSLYEGFGLPILEAMLLGTPVMSSNRSSVPEVAGDAALLVDPYDVKDMAAAIRTLDSNAELREALSVRGRAQAAKFDESTYRQRIAAVYEQTLARHGTPR